MSALNAKYKDKVYLFDFDGTVADSMSVAVDLVLSFLRERGIAYPPDVVKTLTPLGFHGIAKYYAEVFGVPMPSQEIFAWFQEKLAIAYATEIPLKKGAKETLVALRERGARVCLLTGSPHSFVAPCLRRAGVFDLFECVWSADDFKLLKSDTKIYDAVAERLGVKVEELLVVDDGIEVLKTAQRAGAQTVGVYDAYSATEEELSATCATWVKNLTQLL